MSALRKFRRFSEAEYLLIENASPHKSEFYDGEMFAMAGAAPDHNSVNENLTLEIGGRLKGGRCRTYSRDQRVRVSATGLYTYPDLLIVCGKREYDRTDPKSLVNPVVLFEVLSPSTAEYDRGTKFGHYQKLPSVQEIVFVSQDVPLVQVYARQPNDTWSLTTFDDLAGDFALRSVPIRVPMGDVYRDVEFQPDEQPSD